MPPTLPAVLTPVQRPAGRALAVSLTAPDPPNVAAAVAKLIADADEADGRPPIDPAAYLRALCRPS